MKIINFPFNLVLFAGCCYKKYSVHRAITRSTNFALPSAAISLQYTNYKLYTYCQLQIRFDFEIFTSFQYNHFDFVVFYLLRFYVDLENTTMFEISVLSCQHISIALEHPFMETMATIELDLTHMPNIKCDIFSLGGNYSSITSGLSRVLQTCASIPITIRTLIKYWEREHLNNMRGLDNTNLSLFCSKGDNCSGEFRFANFVAAFYSMNWD